MLYTLCYHPMLICVCMWAVNHTESKSVKAGPHSICCLNTGQLFIPFLHNNPRPNQTVVPRIFQSDIITDKARYYWLYSTTHCWWIYAKKCILWNILWDRGALIYRSKPNNQGFPRNRSIHYVRKMLSKIGYFEYDNVNEHGLSLWLSYVHISAHMC